MINNDLTLYVRKVEASQDQLTADRRELLLPIFDFCASRKGQSINLVFICTHNSRRSHLAHVWADLFSKYFKLDNINCYSSGTEATAIYFQSKESLERSGFQFNKIENGANPKYMINAGFEKQIGPIYSKSIDDLDTNGERFVAIMVCDHADQNCPFIPEAEQRYSLPYRDPKEFDTTPTVTDKYDERSFQISQEMYFLMKQIAESYEH